MPFAGRSRSSVHAAVLAGCLLLAFAVFAWGLHAKLSLYGPGVEPSSQTVAKLLMNQRPEAMVAAYPSAAPRSSLETMFLLAGAMLLFPMTRVRWLEMVRRRTEAGDDPDPPENLSRPPPVGCLSR